LQGGLAANEGRYSAAREHYDRALELSRVSRDKVFESVQLANLGEVERAVGNYTAAAERLETGLVLCRDAGATMFRAHYLGELGEIAVARDDAASALAVAADGLLIARETSHGDLEAWINVVRGDAQLALGQLSDAAESYHHALRIHRQLGRTTAQLYPLAGLARVTAGQGNIEEALAHASRVEAAVRGGAEPNGAPALLWACHTVMVAAGSPRAQEVLNRAHSMLTERAKLLDGADGRPFLDNVPPHRAIMKECAAPIWFDVRLPRRRGRSEAPAPQSTVTEASLAHRDRGDSTAIPRFQKGLRTRSSPSTRPRRTNGSPPGSS
jgi:tetratricopeptide (TPR) repeat protein